MLRLSHSLPILLTVAATHVPGSSLEAAPQGGAVWFVDDDAAPGSGDGSSAHPFFTIQEAINAAVTGDTVLVQDGTYSPTMGGYVTDLLNKNLTVISANGPATTILQGAEYTYMAMANQDERTLVSGFTFRGGAGSGAMIVLNGSSPRIENCVFENNATGTVTRPRNGGAVNIVQSTPSFTDCVFRNNSSNAKGGAVYAQNLVGQTVSFQCCEFRGNQAVKTGGGVCVELPRSSPGGATFSGCTFGPNYAPGISGNPGASGGTSVHLDGALDCAFDDCLFKDSRTSQYALNAVDIYFSRAVFRHCVAEGTRGPVGNQTFETRQGSTAEFWNCRLQDNEGWGVISNGNGGGSILVVGCQFIGNRSTSYEGSALYLNDSTIVNCLFHGNVVRAPNPHGGAALAGERNRITQCLFVANASEEGPGGAIRHNDNVITSCTFYGNTAGVPPSVILTDFPGTNAMYNSIVVGGTPPQMSDDPGAYVDIHDSIVDGGHTTGTNIYTFDPIFTDPDGPDDDLSTWEDNDFSLAPGSPAIDLGDVSWLGADVADLDGDGDTAEPLPLDFTGPPRVAGASVDLGACEGPWGPFPVITAGASTCSAQPPIADAGSDQAVDENTLVVLDGSHSTDPDGGSLTFLWSQVAGTAVMLDLTDPAHPSFVAPFVPAGGETLTFELVVDDGELSSDPASVNVTVRNVNHAPFADAGADQVVGEGTTVLLDASGSFDEDGDDLTYSWTQTAGTPVTLTGADTASPTFIAPLVGPAGDLLRFDLSVDDGLLATGASVAVTVENVNHDPVASAGPDQTQDEGTPVHLDASASDDPDGDALTFSWTQLAGPTVALYGEASATPSFDAPEVVAMTSVDLVFAVTVSDGYGGSATDEVVVHVLDTNAPPACDLAVPSVSELWPPNHKLTAVEILGISDPDADDVVLTILDVTQDEPLNGLGDGDTAPDAVIQGSTVLLRAERQGGGNGRVYHIRFQADDGVGGVCTGTVTVCVPHDRRGGSTCVDDGQAFSSLEP